MKDNANQDREDWWIPLTYDSRLIQHNKKKEATEEDFKVAHCLKCNKAWERFWEGNKSKWSYYVDFPTLSAKKVTCPDCKEEIEEDSLNAKRQDN